MNIGGGHKNLSGRTFNIAITDTVITSTASTSFDLFLQAEGFKIKYKGEDAPYDGLKASSCSATFYVTDGTDEATLLTPFTSPNSNYYMFVFKDESTLIWQGFVTSKLASINQTGYPKAITIEAVDRITLTKYRSLWDITTKRWTTDFSSNLFSTVSGIPDTINDPVSPAEDILFRMGEPYSGVGSLNPSARFPTFIEMIWSVLFDVDRNTNDELYVIEHYDFQQQDTRITGGLANSYLDMNYAKFADHPDQKEKSNTSLYDLINEACLLFNARLFQWNGKYYLIQNEIYQHANTVNFYRYERGAAIGKQPVDLANGTLTSSSYKQSLFAPSTGNKPNLRTYTNDEYDQALKKVELNYVKGLSLTTVVPYNMSITTQTTITNVHRWSEVVESVSIKSMFRNGMWIDQGGSALSIPNCLRPDADNTNQGGDFHEHCVMGRYEARSGVNKKMDAKLLDDGTYEPQKAITYDSSDWIWTELSYASEMDEWDGVWYQMNASTTNSPGYTELFDVTE